MFEYTDIKTAPAALGPYSQAVMAGNTLYASGAIGIDPETGKFAGEDVKSQCEQACKNVGEILKANGMTYDNVVKTTCYILDMAEFKDSTKCMLSISLQSQLDHALQSQRFQQEHSAKLKLLQ